MNTGHVPVEVYYENNGVRHILPVMVRFDVETQDIERGLIDTLGGHYSCKHFEQLAAEQGWNNAYWTFPGTRRVTA